MCGCFGCFRCQVVREIIEYNEDASDWAVQSQRSFNRPDLSSRFPGRGLIMPGSDGTRRPDAFGMCFSFCGAKGSVQKKRERERNQRCEQSTERTAVESGSSPPVLTPHDIFRILQSSICVAEARWHCRHAACGGNNLQKDCVRC